LVKILELIQIEQYVPVTARRQRLGRPIKEREAITRALVAKAVVQYPHTRSLRKALQSTPNLRMICGFARRQEVPAKATAGALAEYARADLERIVHDALV